MASKPYSPTRNPIARAIHCIVITAIVITLTMWTSDYIHAWIDHAAQQRLRMAAAGRARYRTDRLPAPRQRTMISLQLYAIVYGSPGYIADADLEPQPDSRRCQRLICRLPHANSQPA